MGYYLCAGVCIRCGQVFSFNPVRVPSIVINGVRQPICLSCVEIINPMRAKLGQPKIEPLPGAYDACDESEMP
jgi:hypothetical protein